MQAENGRPMRHSETISRRELVRRTGLAATAALLLPEAVRAAESARPKVVVVTSREPMRAGNTPLPLIEKMVERGVTTLTGMSDPMQAWASLVPKTADVCLASAGGQLENVPELNIAIYR